jgi:hypothetical protein
MALRAISDALGGALIMAGHFTRCEVCDKPLSCVCDMPKTHHLCFECSREAAKLANVILEKIANKFNTKEIA